MIGYGMLLRIGCRQLGAVGQENIVHLIQIDDLIPNRKVNLCAIFHDNTGRVVTGLVRPAIKVSRGTKVLGSMVSRCTQHLIVPFLRKIKVEIQVEVLDNSARLLYNI